MATGVPHVAQRNRDIRAAMWSVYYHTSKPQILRPSVFETAGITIFPIPLHAALSTVRRADDALADQRRLRVFGKLGFAQLMNRARVQQIRDAAETAPDREWFDRIRRAEAEIAALMKALDVRVDALDETSFRDFKKFFEMLMASHAPSCQVRDSSCETVFDVDPENGRPMTTATVQGTVSRTPPQLARVFDPRSWGTCLDHFDTLRVQPKDANGDYQAWPLPDRDPVGEPWPDASAPHLFWERVTTESIAGTNVFENILEMTAFTVDAHTARLDYDLHESTTLEYPDLNLTLGAGVTIDNGYMSAVALPNDATGLPWSEVTLVKNVQFIDLSPGTTPFYDPGEVLNYLAPAMLCMWLEDAVSSAPCCRV